ncbi:MAG: SIMPL domain-containing protein [Candidatus Nomurabacteria bacterium]|nr:SIMPL domain-containing protein [Candidatus Nomurabacteria bacterium]
METFLNEKKIKNSIFALIIVISLLTVVKLYNEIKSSAYVGRGNQPANVISVSGTGDILAVSDIASLTVNLNKEGKTAKEAQTLLNESITKTLAYLKEQKIEDKDIKSEYGGLSPKYSYGQVACLVYPCPTQEPKIIGYTAMQSITIKIRVVDNASIVRTGLTAIGVTDISGPTFSIDDEEAFKDQARSKAIIDAKAKAEVLSKELGVTLGKVVSFSENTGNNYGVYAKTMAVDSLVSAPEAPVLPKGENKITSNVSIAYEIR